MQTYETLEDAKSLAEEVLSGSMASNTGCALISSIARKLDFPNVLLPFMAVAHEQEGHEQFGITPESCIDEIRRACHRLVDGG